jgi:hypothetical protein
VAPLAIPANEAGREANELFGSGPGGFPDDLTRQLLADLAGNLLAPGRSERARPDHIAARKRRMENQNGATPEDVSLLSGGDSSDVVERISSYFRLWRGDGNESHFAVINSFSEAMADGPPPDLPAHPAVGGRRSVLPAIKPCRRHGRRQRPRETAQVSRYQGCAASGYAQDNSWNKR